MASVLKFYKGSERPGVSLTWRGNDGAVIDFSTGYEFQFKLGTPGRTADITKVTGISGAQTSPNIVINFTVGELDSIAADMYVGQLRARETASQQDRFLHLWFHVLDPVN